MTSLPIRTTVIPSMKVAGRELLIPFMKRHTDAKGALDSWLQEVSRADWKGPQDIKEKYRTASFLEDNRIIFNIKGNRYRLVVKVAYQAGVLRILWVGTHAEYDKLAL